MVNKTILVGRCGGNVETKKVGETQVTSFSLATSEKYTNKAGEKVEETEWHNIVMWRKLAEIAEKYVNKGDLLYIEGKLKTRSWEKDGVKKYRTEVVADTMKMLGGKKQEKEPVKPDPDKSDINNNDDLPF